MHRGLCHERVPENLEVPVGDLVARVKKQPVDADELAGALIERAVEERLTLRELGELYTRRILELTGGNKVKAAGILGINRRTLYRRGERNGPSGNGDGDTGSERS